MTFRNAAELELPLLIITSDKLFPAEIYEGSLILLLSQDECKANPSPIIPIVLAQVQQDLPGCRQEMLKVTVLKPLESLIRHVVKTATPDFKRVNVKELLKQMLTHLRLRIVGLDFWDKFVYDDHAEVNQFLQQVLFQGRMHQGTLKA
jgi:hypothetical protein